MTAMLTDMKLIPHRSFGMPGGLQQHMLVYTIVIAILLTIFFDLSRIASLGAIYYLVMDIAVQYGVYKHMRKDIQANGTIVITAIVLDVLVLGGFLWTKASSDILIVIFAIVSMLFIFGSEKWFLKQNNTDDSNTTK